VSWKADLRLADLDDRTQIECTCRKCGHTHYADSSALIVAEGFAQLYLDEVEARLRCSAPSCRGSVRIAIVYDDTEGFVGGMA
jgi:hypothetical protein